jgi:hypothetical protein
MLQANCKIALKEPTVTEGGVGGNRWWVQITGQTHLHPWGTGGPNQNSNLNITLSALAPDGSDKSTLTFGDPGVYFLTWYQTMTAPTAGTMALGPGVSFNNSNQAPGVAANPRVYHPAGEQMGWALVNVTGTNQYLTYTHAAGPTPTTNVLNSLQVFLTNYPLPTVSLAVASEIDELVSQKVKEALRGLSVQDTRDKAPPFPFLPPTVTPSPKIGEAFTTTGTATFQSINQPPVAVNFTMDTNQDFPLNVIVDNFPAAVQSPDKEAVDGQPVRSCECCGSTSPL